MNTQRSALTLSTRRLYGLPLMGVIPIILVAVVAGVYLIGGANPAEWVLPILTMVSIGVFAILLLGAGVGLVALIERASIQRVLNEPWARWPQYATEESWHKAVSNERDEVVKEAGFFWAPLIAIGVLLGISLIVTYFATKDNPGSDFGKVILVIGVLYVVVALALALRAILTRGMAEQRYRTKVQHAPPDAVIGEGGVYHEDQGFTSFRWLCEVRFKEPTKSRGALIELEIFRPATHRTVSLEETYRVRVPRGQEEEAQHIVERIRAHRRLR